MSVIVQALSTCTRLISTIENHYNNLNAVVKALDKLALVL